MTFRSYWRQDDWDNSQLAVQMLITGFPPVARNLHLTRQRDER